MVNYFTCVLFDLDGTIGNTLPLCIAAFREAVEPLTGRQISDEEIVATFGPSEEGTIRTLVPLAFEEGLRRYLASYECLHPGWPQPFEGMTEILSFLKNEGVFLGLVTGKGRLSASITLRRYGLTDMFDTVKTGSPEGPVKDKRIEEVIQEFSLRREELLFVGDAPTDIRTARTCRISIAAAAWAPTADWESLRAGEPDFFFTSVAEFRNMVRTHCVKQMG